MDLLGYLKKEFRAAIDAHSEAIARGVADDYPQYTGMVGRRAGLVDGLRFIQELEDKLNREEDLEFFDADD